MDNRCYVLFAVVCCLLQTCAGQSGVNVARQGWCRDSPGSNSCYGAIDGEKTPQNDDDRFVMGGNGLLAYIVLRFTQAYDIHMVVVYHDANLNERNCLTIRMSFKDSGGSEVDEVSKNLYNRTPGPGQSDVISLDPPIDNVREITITCMGVYNAQQQRSSFAEIQVFNGIPGTGIPTTPVAPTTPSTTGPPTKPPTVFATAPGTSRPTTNGQTTRPTTTTTTTTTTSPPTTTTQTPSPTTTTAQPTSARTSPEEARELPLSTLASMTTAAEDPGTAAEFIMSSTTIIIIAVVAGVLVLAIIAALLYLFCIRRRNKKDVESTSPLVRRGGSRPVSGLSNRLSAVSGSSGAGRVTVLKLEEDQAARQLYDRTPIGKPVPVAELADYIKGMADTQAAFQKEFKSIPSGLQAAAQAGQRSGVKDKNRFRNIVPYDHDRVVLSTMAGDPDSTYINASFVDGYTGPKQFIAAQGPNNLTCADFWRMIWEQKAFIVVMLANTTENGKNKCNQYWPDEAFEAYHNIEVKRVEEERGPDYTVRHFKVRQHEQVRDVRQYHYTAWPDEGVPDTCSAVISFTKRIRADAEDAAGPDPDDRPPLVVHCSAGVGRTGTYIALNYLLEQAAAEGRVDVLTCAHMLRAKRPNMIQSLEQYRFLHLMLLEALTVADVSVPRAEFKETYARLQQPAEGGTGLQRQLQILEAFQNRKYDEQCDTARKEENRDKVRNSQVLPGDAQRAHVLPLKECPTSFINAVFLKGYRSRSDLLVTQAPGGEHLLDIWRLATDFGCRTIVMLNPLDDDTPAYWPEEDADLELGPFTVAREERDERKHVTFTKLAVQCDHRKSDEAMTVGHFAARGWEAGSTYPADPAALPALVDEVAAWRAGLSDGRMLVHCRDAGERSGLYCCLQYTMNKLAKEKEVDVFNAVKNTRFSRPMIIPDIEQYSYLHDVIKRHLEVRDSYDNVRLSSTSTRSRLSTIKED